jgi:hypothetical protein
MISVSIDERAQRAYDAIPHGMKSGAIRRILIEGEALVMAESECEGLKAALRILTRKLVRAELDLENCRLGLLDAAVSE